jgi:hypothetical protein
MKNAVVVSLTLAVAVSLSIGSAAAAAPAAAAPAEAKSPEAPKIKVPEPGVPQIMTIKGRYIRAAYNGEGYAIIGYKTANNSVGEEWMLLDVGITLREGVPSFTLKREGLSIETPDGKTIPLASNTDYRKANLKALEQRAKIARDNINYFPPQTRDPYRLGFFADLDQRAAAWDQVELSVQRAAVGQIFFHVPGGIKHGQYWLNVKLKDSVVRVPFRILTDEENKTLDEHFDDIQKQVDDAFRTKG